MGMFAVRGGTVASEHTLYFRRRRDPFDHPQRRQPPDFCRRCGEAAALMTGKSPGFYSLDDILFSPVISTERMG